MNHNIHPKKIVAAVIAFHCAAVGLQGGRSSDRLGRRAQPGPCSPFLTRTVSRCGTSRSRAPWVTQDGLVGLVVQDEVHLGSFWSLASRTPAWETI